MKLKSTKKKSELTRTQTRIHDTVMNMCSTDHKTINFLYRRVAFTISLSIPAIPVSLPIPIRISIGQSPRGVGERGGGLA